MGLPEVTVVTATWLRHDLLVHRCMPSVLCQNYEGGIWHIIVSDGPDPNLQPQRFWLGTDGNRMTYFDCLSEHTGDWGASPRRHGLKLAHTPYVAYLDDDNAYQPHHIRTLIEAIENSRADFVYSRQRRLAPDGTVRGFVGSDPPGIGSVDSSLLLHRRELPTTWEDRGYASDAAQVMDWVANGARWHHVPVVTMDYYEP